MKPYDVVRLIKPYRGMKIGTEGTILDEYYDEAVEVEFFDENYRMIDVCPITKDYLELVKEYPPK